MRTQSLNGITITYPDLLIYSKDRCVINITGAASSDRVVSIIDGREDVKYCYAGNCQNDISSFINAIFEVDRSTDFQTYQSTSVILIVGTTQFFISFNVIFGKQTILNKGFKMDFLPRTICDNGNYTFYYALFESAEIAISVDGSTWTELYVKSKGLYSIDLSAYTDTGCYLRIGNTYSTFDYTYDITFTGGTSNVIYFESVCFKNPYQLRWLDNFGIWQTQCFEKITETQATTSVSEFEYNETEFDGLIVQEKDGLESIELIAEDLDANNQKRILSLLNATYIHILIDNVYYPISIVSNGGKIATRQPYQDIVINCKIQNV